MFLEKFMKLSCRDVSALVSEQMDRDLPFFRRLRLKFHLTICGACKNYQTQLETLKRMCASMGEEDSAVKQDISLSPPAKEKIKQALKH